jgi:hypothetical protein
MKKLLLALALLVAPTAAFADAAPPPAPTNINTTGLTAEQMKQVQEQADQLRAASPEAQTQATLERVQQYVEVGKGIGAGLGEAARSMGVAVNDFANTPVGRLTTFVIIWKVMGHDFLGILAGLIWMAVMIPLWVSYFRRICLQGNIVETFDKETGKLLTRKAEALDLHNGDVAGYRILMFIVLAMVCAAGFVMIF